MSSAFMSAAYIQMQIIITFGHEPWSDSFTSAAYIQMHFMITFGHGSKHYEPWSGSILFAI